MTTIQRRVLFTVIISLLIIFGGLSWELSATSLASCFWIISGLLFTFAPLFTED